MFVTKNEFHSCMTFKYIYMYSLHTFSHYSNKTRTKGERGKHIVSGNTFFKLTRTFVVNALVNTLIKTFKGNKQVPTTTK